MVVFCLVVGQSIGYSARNSEIADLKKQIVDLISEKDVLIGNIQDYEKSVNKNKNKIVEYILATYRKVPPVLAKEIAKVILEKSAEHNVSYHVIMGVIEVESNFNPFSVSNLKTDPARGLMQVRYNIWKDDLNLESPYDLHSISGGIDAGTRILRKYLDQTNNDLDKTLYKYVGKNKSYVKKVYNKIGKFVTFIN